MKAHDRAWVIAKRESDKGLWLVRLMQLEASFPFKRYPERLNITWPFRKTAVNGTPAPKESNAMERFENRICKHIEKSGQAVLCIVFTEPGYREYVFHCQQVESFLTALSEIPQESAPYPLEIHHETDAAGKFYKSYAKKLA